MIDFLVQRLEERKQIGTFRTLFVPKGLIDFASNDYLGFAQKLSSEQHFKTSSNNFGATGSRLISGNTTQAEDLEKHLAEFHEAEAGLLFNSGYDANVGLLACLAGEADTYLSDELIHASMIDGMRLSKAQRLRFKHNDLDDLAKKLAYTRTQKTQGEIFICIESVYSMDGDVAPLNAIQLLASQYGAHLIVDEAHATGIVGKAGKGLVQALGLENEVLARVHTFGKALGVHGAVVLGRQVLRDYLINFARSFIYSTALPTHSLTAIRLAYDLLHSPYFQTEREKLHQNIQSYKAFAEKISYKTLDSNTAIQGVLVGNNAQAKDLQSRLQKAGIYAKAILSPTVAKGTERLRICLHSFNTEAEIALLFDCF